MQNSIKGTHKGSVPAADARSRASRQAVSAVPPRPVTPVPGTKIAWRPDVGVPQAGPSSQPSHLGPNSSLPWSGRSSSVVPQASSTGRWPANWRDGDASNQSSTGSMDQAALATFPTDAKQSALRKLVVDSAYESQIVQVKFCLKYRTSYGQTVKLLGSHPQLGSWDLLKAVDLKWTDGDRWVTTLDLPAGAVYEYKYVLIDHDTQSPLAWQNGGNSVLALQDEDNGVAVEDNWGNTPGANLSINGTPMTRESKLQSWAKEMASYKATAKTAAAEIARKSDELQAAKAQVARLKMELSLSVKAREEVEAKVVELQQENVLLKSQVAQSQMAMKSTLEEAIKLLAEEMEEEEEDDSNGASAQNEPSTSSSSNGGAFGFNWGRSAEPTHSYAYSSSNKEERGTVERFGIRMSAESERSESPRSGGWASGWRSALSGGQRDSNNDVKQSQAQARFSSPTSFTNWRSTSS